MLTHGHSEGSNISSCYLKSKPVILCRDEGKGKKSERINRSSAFVPGSFTMLLTASKCIWPQIISTGNRSAAGHLVSCHASSSEGSHFKARVKTGIYRAASVHGITTPCSWQGEVISFQVVFGQCSWEKEKAKYFQEPSSAYLGGEEGVGLESLQGDTPAPSLHVPKSRVK